MSATAQKTGLVWLDQALTEVKGDFKDPGAPIEDGEEVVGVMCPFARALYTVSHRLATELFHLKLRMVEAAGRAAFAGRSAPDLTSDLDRAKLLHERGAFLHTYLWQVICEDLELRGDPFGLRREYQVVKEPDRECVAENDVKFWLERMFAAKA